MLADALAGPSKVRIPIVLRLPQKNVYVSYQSGKFIRPTKVYSFSFDKLFACLVKNDQVSIPPRSFSISSFCLRLRPSPTKRMKRFALCTATKKSHVLDYDCMRMRLLLANAHVYPSIEVYTCPPVVQAFNVRS